MKRVVVVGSFNVDHAWRAMRLPQAGETIEGRYRSGPGGKGFNQAVAAARAGAETSFICALGEDAGGQLARALATAEGIDLRDACVDASTGTAGIFVDAQGRNSIVVGAGANALLSPDFIAAQHQHIATADVVLAQLETPPGTALAALQAARAGNAIALLNPAPANVDASAELLAQVDVLTPNETEFAALLAHHVGERVPADDIATLDLAHLHALCRELLAHGTVVVTLGASGCFVSHAEAARRGDAQPCYRVPAEVVQTIDTTGAGDAFNGALAAALAREPGAAFARHVRFASRFAALSTEREGAALGMPQLNDVEARFHA